MKKKTILSVLFVLLISSVSLFLSGCFNKNKCDVPGGDCKNEKTLKANGGETEEMVSGGTQGAKTFEKVLSQGKSSFNSGIDSIVSYINQELLKKGKSKQKINTSIDFGESKVEFDVNSDSKYDLEKGVILSDIDGKINVKSEEEMIGKFKSNIAYDISIFVSKEDGIYIKLGKLKIPLKTLLQNEVIGKKDAKKIKNVMTQLTGKWIDMNISEMGTEKEKEQIYKIFTEGLSLEKLKKVEKFLTAYKEVIDSANIIESNGEIIEYNNKDAYKITINKEELAKTIILVMKKFVSFIEENNPILSEGETDIQGDVEKEVKKMVDAMDLGEYEGYLFEDNSGIVFKNIKLIDETKQTEDYEEGTIQTKHTTYLDFSLIDGNFNIKAFTQEEGNEEKLYETNFTINKKGENGFDIHLLISKSGNKTFEMSIESDNQMKENEINTSGKVSITAYKDIFPGFLHSDITIKVNTESKTEKLDGEIKADIKSGETLTLKQFEDILSGKKKGKKSTSNNNEFVKDCYDGSNDKLMKDGLEKKHIKNC